MKGATLAAGALGLGLVLALGLYLLVIGARNVYRASASTGWPRTEGVVADNPEATIVFYHAAGERSTDQLRFGQTFSTTDPSEDELRRVRYPAGARVTVSYDPARPWIACVKPGLHGDVFWLPGAGLAFILPIVMCGLVFSDVLRGQPAGLGNDKGMAAAAGVFAGMACALGLIGVASGGARLWRGYSSRSWPVAEGEVIYSQVAGTTTHDEETRRTTTTWAPRFVYRYQVNGVTHYNNLRRFGRIEGAGEDWAAEIAERYPLGRKVAVRYLAGDPDVAALEPGNASEGLWLPGVSLVVLLFGVAVYVWIVPGIARGR